ncbi:50S ribosomal protein L34e [Nanoarchaeota archaeon]
MPRGSLKSRTLRRVFVKTPGSKTKVQYRKRKPSKAKCGKCEAVLSGVPRERPKKMQKMSKTKKRPQRPFGGVLCTKCTRIEIIKRNK